MAKESFNWKSLFINDADIQANNDGQPQPVSPAQNNKFPETTTNSTPVDSSANPFLAEVLEVYQKGFEGLNAEGFDFFEMYKSVNAVGVNNPQSYQMAFTMGKTINPSLTKEFLVEKAKYYTTEIEKVYEKYNIRGNSKKSELGAKINEQKKSLTQSIGDIESQLVRLQKDLEDKRMELGRIDSDNAQEFSELQLKIEANNMAKQRIQESIATMVNGINQYL